MSMGKSIKNQKYNYIKCQITEKINKKAEIILYINLFFES